MAVLDTRVEEHTVAATAEGSIERGDDRMTLRTVEMARREVDHDTRVVDGDEVASVRDLVGTKLHAHRRGLDRCSPGVVLGRVVSEDREVPHVASRR